MQKKASQTLRWYGMAENMQQNFNKRTLKNALFKNLFIVSVLTESH